MKSFEELQHTANEIEREQNPLDRCIMGLVFICDVLDVVTVNKASASNLDAVRTGIVDFFIENSDVVFPDSGISYLDKMLAKLETAIEKFEIVAANIAVMEN
jgi:hypothetical protein